MVAKLHKIMFIEIQKSEKPTARPMIWLMVAPWQEFRRSDPPAKGINNIAGTRKE